MNGPPDWEDEVARAYAVFGIDPIDAELGFRFPKLSTSFLRTKALRQLRDRFGRWRQERGDLDDPLEVARMRAEASPDIPLKRVVTNEQVDAALEGLLPDNPDNSLAYSGQPERSPTAVRNLLLNWIDNSHHFRPAPDVELPMQASPPDDEGYTGEGEEIWVTDDLVVEPKHLAKALVAARLSDATKETIPTDDLRDLAGTEIYLIGSKRIVSSREVPYNATHLVRPAGDEDGDVLAVLDSVPIENALIHRRYGEIPKEASSGEYEDGGPYAWASDHGIPEEDYDIDTAWVAEVGTPEADSMLREYYMSKIINAWAQSANGNPLSLAFQEVAKGLTDPDFEHKEWNRGVGDPRVDRIIREHGDALLEILKAQQAGSRDLLASLGAESGLPLSRGVATTLSSYKVSPEARAVLDQELPGEKPWEHGEPVQIGAVQRPLSSWATNAAVAATFTMNPQFYTAGSIPLLMGAGIPLEEILATTLTGFGAYNEAEIVALAAERLATAVRVNDEEDIYEFGSTWDWNALLHPDSRDNR